MEMLDKMPPACDCGDMMPLLMSDAGKRRLLGGGDGGGNGCVEMSARPILEIQKFKGCYKRFLLFRKKL